jgi:hypothetical protein
MASQSKSALLNDLLARQLEVNSLAAEAVPSTEWPAWHSYVTVSSNTMLPMLDGAACGRGCGLPHTFLTQSRRLPFFFSKYPAGQTQV